jgi:16S rRNA (uracil1498-N3)-methyltransferase
VKQFILSEEPDRSGAVRLKGDDYRYLVRVRRIAPGEFFPAVLPNGEKTLVQVLSVDSGVLIGKCVSAPETAQDKAAVNTPGTPLPPIILFQALPKGEKMDLIVRQAAEGGITEIGPFVSEFSITKTGEQKFSRWERVIKEARQQSGSAIATAIRRPLKMEELLNYWEKLKENGRGPGAPLGLLFHHQPLVHAGLHRPASLHEYLEKNPQLVVLTIGPEGGFSDNEVSGFLKAGFKPLTIGDTILRTETAALYAAAAIRILLLERNWWKLKQIKSSSV